MYKNDQGEKALHLFKKIIREFGNDSPEVSVSADQSITNLRKSMHHKAEIASLKRFRYNYYGEILLDRGEFASALENLDKAIVLEKAKAR